MCKERGGYYDGGNYRVAGQGSPKPRRRRTSLATRLCRLFRSRTYYAMFYCAEALLFSRELSFGKHSAVISAFGKHFVKTGVFNPKFHRYLLDAFDVRNLGDYGTMHVVSKEKAAELLTWGREFLLEVKLVLKDS
ncbi:MAG: HEPN domain-containing protein [Desulfuromonadales bacterium]|nr:HEPN domain-containing protein [Desulfuromonadales bacterium]